MPTDSFNLRHFICEFVLAMMTSPTSSPAKQQPVLSLLDKYSNIHRGIEQAREESARIRSQVEDATLKIEGLQTERESLQCDIVTIESERRNLEDDKTKERSKLVQLERANALAALKNQQAKNELLQTRKLERHLRRNFIDESQEFRSSCKRQCVRAGLLGLKYAPLRAYLLARGMNKKFRFQVEDQADSLEGGEGQAFRSLETAHKLESCRNSHAEIKNAFQEVVSSRGEVSEKIEDCKNRKLQLQTQLDRIQRNISEFESQIRALEHRTAEAKQNASKFGEKGKSNARLRFDSNGCAIDNHGIADSLQRTELRAPP